MTEPTVTPGGLLEAVQYGEWGVWHAVRPDNPMRTFCGLEASKARQMWEDWPEKTHRCRRCVAAGGVHVVTAPRELDT